MPVLKTENPVDGLKMRSESEIREIRIRKLLEKYKGDKSVAIKTIAKTIGCAPWRVRQEARIVRKDLVESVYSVDRSMGW